MQVAVSRNFSEAGAHTPAATQEALPIDEGSSGFDPGRRSSLAPGVSNPPTGVVKVFFFERTVPTLNATVDVPLPWGGAATG